MDIELKPIQRTINASKLIERLRERAQDISDNVSENDSEWPEIGLMRDAADVIERLIAK